MVRGCYLEAVLGGEESELEMISRELVRLKISYNGPVESVHVGNLHYVYQF